MQPIICPYGKRPHGRYMSCARDFKVPEFQLKHAFWPIFNLLLWFNWTLLLDNYSWYHLNRHIKLFLNMMKLQPSYPFIIILLSHRWRKGLIRQLKACTIMPIILSVLGLNVCMLLFLVPNHTCIILYTDFQSHDMSFPIYAWRMRRAQFMSELFLMISCSERKTLVCKWFYTLNI